ncbi:hypothetical protein WH47_00352 [Habropoda laboriosa]|uniref:Uncharacterized protein n=1 Tax=Habropoda laboriosa TaxID=597456 RepID=A0A0L7R1Z3_9HYME|nr:hypothetical protein WH47_00352 [Habropoda laboriosa]
MYRRSERNNFWSTQSKFTWYESFGRYPLVSKASFTRERPQKTHQRQPKPSRIRRPSSPPKGTLK